MNYIKRRKRVTQSKFKKNERIKIKLDDWDKTYGGVVKRVHDTRKGFKYDVKLDESEGEEEYEIVRKFLKIRLKKLKKKQKNMNIIN